MVFDKVHDTQEVFRTILHCMSRPGTIQHIDDRRNRMEQLENCNTALFLSAMTLLDAEVSFHIIGEASKRIGSCLPPTHYQKWLPCMRQIIYSSYKMLNHK